jgi:hypothetical protein
VTALGGVIDHSSQAPAFTLSPKTLVVYGFAASVLPVWMLLAPRDYLSTFMKVGTIGLLALAHQRREHSGEPVLSRRDFECRRMDRMEVRPGQRCC